MLIEELESTVEHYQTLKMGNVNRSRMGRLVVGLPASWDKDKRRKRWGIAMSLERLINKSIQVAEEKVANAPNPFFQYSSKEELMGRLVQAQTQETLKENPSSNAVLIPVQSKPQSKSKSSRMKQNLGSLKNRQTHSLQKQQHNAINGLLMRQVQSLP